MGDITHIDINSRYQIDITFILTNMINIKDFNPSLIKIAKKSYKNIGIYHIGYITMKDFDRVKINSENPLYLMIGEVDGYIEENNGNK